MFARWTCLWLLLKCVLGFGFEGFALGKFWGTWRRTLQCGEARLALEHEREAGAPKGTALLVQRNLSAYRGTFGASSTRSSVKPHLFHLSRITC
jgi:hypothetical protein